MSSAASRASDLAQDVAGRAKQTASDAASTIADQVKEVLGRQIGSGVEVVGKLASSTNRAADDLEQSAPVVAGMVRSVAQRMDGYANGLRDQSVDDLVRAASDLTRRQPALVFGLAAFAGFLVFRTVKNAAPTRRSFSRYPYQERARPGAGEFHGA